MKSTRDLISSYVDDPNDFSTRDMRALQEYLSEEPSAKKDLANQLAMDKQSACLIRTESDTFVGTVEAQIQNVVRRRIGARCAVGLLIAACFVVVVSSRISQSHSMQPGQEQIVSKPTAPPGQPPAPNSIAPEWVQLAD